MTPVPAYPMRKSNSASLTLASIPLDRFLASVQSELQTAMSIAEGIHPASARMNPKVIAFPLSSGHGVHWDEPIRGSVIAAAAIVHTVSASNTPFIVRSSARNRPRQSRSAAPAMISAPTSATDQSTPSSCAKAKAVNKATAAWITRAVLTVIRR